MADFDDINIQLPSSDKVENEGKTSQGRASSSEWNLLVKAVARLKDAVVALKKYIDEKEPEHTDIDVSLNEQSNNAIANSVVASNIKLIKETISKLLSKLRTKDVEVVNEDDEAKLNINADETSASVNAKEDLYVNAENGVVNLNASSVVVNGESNASIQSDNVAGIVAGDSGVYADATDNKVHIVGSDIEFTYHTQDDNGNTVEKNVSITQIVNENGKSIDVDTTLDEHSNNAIANSIVSATFENIKKSISGFIDKFGTKRIEVLDGEGNANAAITADGNSTTVIANKDLTINSANGTTKVEASVLEEEGKERVSIKSDVITEIKAGGSNVSVNGNDNMVHIVGNDTEFTYLSQKDGASEKKSVLLSSILNGMETDKDLKLISYDEYRAIPKKEMKHYYVAKDEEGLRRNKCWRIYLRAQLVGEFDVEGNLTLPVFPMRFPFRLA